MIRGSQPDTESQFASLLELARHKPAVTEIERELFRAIRRKPTKPVAVKRYLPIAGDAEQIAVLPGKRPGKIPARTDLPLRAD